MRERPRDRLVLGQAREILGLRLPERRPGRSERYEDGRERGGRST
jgi:hypothetical protein